MAPLEYDGGGGGGPSYEGPSTEVDPGNLESFGEFLDELAGGWNDESGYARTLDSQEKGGSDWPQLGVFAAATELEGAYETAHSQMCTAAGQVHALLTGLAEATRKIAENYRGSEQLAQASVGEVESLLGEHLDVGGGPEGMPPDGSDPSQSGGTQPQPEPQP